MFKTLQRYLVSETIYTIGTVLLILLIILSSNTMMRLIEEAAEGNFPTYLLFPTIVIKIAQYSIYLIPISLFFGIILSLGKLYDTNEMAVISSAGLSPIDIAKLLLSVIVIVSIIVATFTLYLTPLASEYRIKLEHRLKNEERIEEITPGKFNSSSSGVSTFFVSNIVEGKLSKMHQHPPHQGPARARLVMPARAAAYAAAEFGRRRANTLALGNCAVSGPEANLRGHGLGAGPKQRIV